MNVYFAPFFGQLHKGLVSESIQIAGKFRRLRVVLLLFQNSHKSKPAFPLVTYSLQMYSLYGL